MNIYRLLSTLFFALLVASSAVAKDVTPHQIVVYGQGTATAEADQAKILFNVVGLGSSLEKAFAEAREKVSKITGQLVELGLKESDFVTSRFHTGENYSKSFFSSGKDFRANLSVYVTVSDFDLLEPVIIQISQNKVQNIYQATFSVNDEAPLNQQARTKAVADAKRKAAEIARTLGIETGGVLFVEEIVSLGGEISPLPRVRMLAGDSREASKGKGIFPERISVESVVKVVFSIKTAR